MQINKWEVRLLRIPLAKPFYTADQAVDHCDTVYLCAHGTAADGWGEVSPGNAPFLSEESASGVFAVIRDYLFPLIPSGRSYETAESIAERTTRIRGNRHAKAAFDLAWHDLDARIKEKPLWETLGGEDRLIEAGLTFDRLPEHQDLYDELERVKAEKFHRITIKMRPGWDLNAVNAARAFCPWPIQIQVDTEGALSFNRQADMLYRIQDFMPAFVEQPFDPADLVTHAMFQETYRTPVCLDESISSFLDASIALDLGSARGFCLKPGRLGGLTETKMVHDAALEAGGFCYSGFDLGTSVAYRHTLAAASLSGCKYPADYIRFGEIFDEEPGRPILPALHEFPGKKESDPKREWQAFTLWKEPGIGFDPDPEILDKYTVDKAEI